jgi:hypothetical protein
MGNHALARILDTFCVKQSEILHKAGVLCRRQGINRWSGENSQDKVECDIADPPWLLCPYKAGMESKCSLQTRAWNRLCTSFLHKFRQSTNSHTGVPSPNILLLWQGDSNYHWPCKMQCNCNMTLTNHRQLAYFMGIQVNNCRWKLVVIEIFFGKR